MMTTNSPEAVTEPDSGLSSVLPISPVDAVGVPVGAAVPTLTQLQAVQLTGNQLLGGPVGTADATVGAGWGVAVGDGVGKAVLTQLQAVQLTGNHSYRLAPES